MLLHTVTLLSPLVSGTVGVGVPDELPVADVDLDVIWLGERFFLPRPKSLKNQLLILAFMPPLGLVSLQFFWHASLLVPRLLCSVMWWSLMLLLALLLKLKMKLCHLM